MLRNCCKTLETAKGENDRPFCCCGHLPMLSLLRPCRFSRVFVLLALALLAPAIVAAVQENPPSIRVEGASVAQDIASAGRLRAQSQRLAKLYQLSSMGYGGETTVQQIVQGSAEMDAEFANLARYGRKVGAKRVYDRCDIIWREFQGLMKNRAARANVERVNQLGDELMIASGKLAMVIEADAETPVGRLLDLSSRLNMLAHRLARLYLQALSGDTTQGVRVDIEQARREFSAGLGELDSARDNTPLSRAAISLARNQWVFFDIAISQLNTTARGDGKALRNVATSSERIGQMLDDASAQYVRDYTEVVRQARR